MWQQSKPCERGSRTVIYGSHALHQGHSAGIHSREAPLVLFSHLLGQHQRLQMWSGCPGFGETRPQCGADVHWLVEWWRWAVTLLHSPASNVCYLFRLLRPADLVQRRRNAEAGRAAQRMHNIDWAGSTSQWSSLQPCIEVVLLLLCLWFLGFCYTCSATMHDPVLFAIGPPAKENFGEIYLRSSPAEMEVLVANHLVSEKFNT